MMRFQILCLIFVLFVVRESRACLINGETGNTLYTQPIMETQRPGIIVWTGESDEEISSVTQSSTRLVLFRSGTSVLIAVSETFAAYIDSIRVNPFNVTLTLNCASGARKIYYLLVNVTDENTKVPTASPTYPDNQMKFILAPGRDPSIPLNGANQMLRIQDRDFEIENAKPQCMSSNELVRIDHVYSNSSVHPEHTWNTLFYLENETNTRFEVEITCSDGLHGVRNLPTLYIIIDQFPPVFTRTFYRALYDGYSHAAPGDLVHLDFVIEAVDPDEPDFHLNYTLSDDTVQVVPGADYLRFTKNWYKWTPLFMNMTATDRSGKSAQVPLVLFSTIDSIPSPTTTTPQSICE